jgi:carboxypeptidase PM20D1
MQGFGHDEEISGFQGAAEIAKLLESRQIKFDFILDEGMLIIQNGIFYTLRNRNT